MPAFSVIFMALCALVVTLPALIGDENNYTYAFFAVVSIAVIGLYIAYVIPTFLRWRMGDSFEPGPWTLGRKYKWVNPAAVIWVIICVDRLQPAAGAGWGVPWTDDFDWKYVNYAPFTVLAVIAAVGLWWLISARRTFTGPIRQVDTDDTGRVIDTARLPTTPTGAEKEASAMFKTILVAMDGSGGLASSGRAGRGVGKARRSQARRGSRGGAHHRQGRR